MKVTVDREVCETHGQCVFVAPHVFDLEDDGALRYEPEPAESEEAHVESAVHACPVQAISLERSPAR